MFQCEICRETEDNKHIGKGSFVTIERVDIDGAFNKEHDHNGFIQFIALEEVCNSPSTVCTNYVSIAIWFFLIYSVSMSSPSSSRFAVEIR